MTKMPDLQILHKLSMSFDEVTEEAHFEKTSFRVKKKIFVTYDEKHHRACVKLTAGDQDIFSVSEGGAIYPVPNKWGQQGWTFVDLDTVKDELLTAVVTTAYCTVAPKYLADKYSTD